jgi:hypothetical protein
MKHPIIAIKSVASLAVALAAATLLRADPIVGGIAFNGTPTFINGDTAVSFGGISVGGGNGDFSGVTADSGSLSFATVIIDPLTLPSGNLWQFTDAGILYSFKASSIDFSTPPPVAGSDPSIWDLSGTGTLSIGEDNFTPTTGTWAITFSQNFILQFEATTGTAVPDGGSTILLLAVGLLGLGVFARRHSLIKI